MENVFEVFKIVRITREFGIGAQPSALDFEAINNAGFAAVLNVRPDSEDGRYLRSKEAEVSAHARGLAYAYNPSENHAIFETSVVDQFERALTKLPQPIFAHCKSGTRTAILWALVAVRHRKVADVISKLRAAGQELEFLEDELKESADVAHKSAFRLKDDAILSLGRSNLLGNKKLD